MSLSSQLSLESSLQEKLIQALSKHLQNIIHFGTNTKKKKKYCFRKALISHKHKLQIILSILSHFFVPPQELLHVFVPFFNLKQNGCFFFYPIPIFQVLSVGFRVILVKLATMSLTVPKNVSDSCDLLQHSILTRMTFFYK